jgi:hypothetical protein
VTAEILIGVSCTVDTRFEAVTTISSRPPEPSEVTGESALTVKGENSPRTLTAAVPVTTALACLECLSEVQIESIPEGRIVFSPNAFMPPP